MAAPHDFYPPPAPAMDEDRQPVSFVDSLLGPGGPARNAPTSPPAGAPVQRAGQAAPATPAATAPGPTAAPPTAGGPALIVPRLIEFDDVELGQRQRRETTLWNPGESEARVTGAELAIDEHQRQFQVRERPERIGSMNQRSAAASGRLAIDFVPQGEGLRTDTLRLTIQTLDRDGHEQVFAIELAGRGHRAGRPAHAESEARRQQDDARTAAETADAEHAASRDARTRRNIEDPRVAPSGRAEAFHARLDDIRDDIRAIDGKRMEGVRMIEREAAAYVRRPAPPTPSTWDYVREGAALALTFASYGLARSLASSLLAEGGSRGAVGVGVGIGDDGHRTPGPPGYRKGIQKSIEKALGKGMQWVIHETVGPGGAGGEASPAPSPSASGSPLSDDASVAFFASQQIALADTSRARLGEITRLGPELVDQLHDEGDFRQVLAVLDAIRADLGQVAGMNAATEQSQATAAQWLSFVSKRSGETRAVAPDARAVAAGTPHADRVSALRPLDARDGVIEIGFSADLKEPAAPVRIVSVRVLGVARSVADRIRAMSLLEAHAPVRAVARELTFGGQNLADPALAVTRDEAGEITVAAGKPGELPDTNLQARYLAAKHAPERQQRGGGADVNAGGRQLVEKDIAGQWGSTLAIRNPETQEPAMRVETDDASKPKH
jgi:hypothetical protein